MPTRDVELAAAEVRRVAAKGARSISLLETPHVQGYPIFLSGYWDPMLQACADENVVLSLHIGAGFDVIKWAPEPPVDHLMVLAFPISAVTAQDTDDEIHSVTWHNACRFLDWDPFRHTSRDQATLGALRARAIDVDVTRKAKEEWRKQNEAAGIGVF